MQNVTDRFYYKDGKLFEKETDVSPAIVDKSHGYKRILHDGKYWLEHRLIWRMFYGNFNYNLDHINGNKLDNRIENLRKCNQTQNTANSKIRSDNKSGYRGVVWHKATNKWQAQTMLKGKRIHIGLFNSKDEAALAYNYKAEELFGPFARFNTVF
jgi:hypothetical protein